MSAPPTILVVEDHDDMRSLLASIYRAAGLHVVEASDAVHALNLLARRPLPDLISTDLAMGRLGGRELLGILAHGAELQKIPTLLVSSDPGLEREAKRLGAAGHCEKGAGMTRLLPVLAWRAFLG